MFAGDEFLDSTYSFGNGTVISLVHTEYPGNVYNNCNITAEYVPCAVCRVPVRWSSARVPQRP